MKTETPAIDLTADVLVIGAGISGLFAAAELQGAGHRVRLLDKGRGVGGRLASRRIGAATFDHGAQFITTRDPRFADVMEQARQAGAAEEWCRGIGKDADGQVRWRGCPTMNSLAKHFAIGLDLSLETPVAALRRAGDRWHAETEKGEIFTATAVVLTPPVPQSLAMLDAGGIELPPEMRTRLAGVAYERCLAVMAVLDGPSRLPPPGGFAPAAGPIAWMADHQMKGSSEEPAVTLHATPAFSLEHWDRDRHESGRRLLGAHRGGFVNLWEVAADGALRDERRIGPVGKTCQGAVFSADEKSIFVAADIADGQLSQWDVETGEELWRSPHLERGLEGVAVLGPDRVVTIGMDARTRLWQRRAVPAPR